jgi:hypothetical protein
MTMKRTRLPAVDVTRTHEIAAELEQILRPGFDQLVRTRRDGWVIRKYAVGERIKFEVIDSAPEGSLGALLVRHQRRVRGKKSVPKYVFELSVTLPAGDDLSVAALNSINGQLADVLQYFLPQFGKTRGRIATEAPFEHVTGGWTPPDENGVCRPDGQVLSIDYDSERA